MSNLVTATNGNQNATLGTLLAGERNHSDAAVSYIAVRDECNATVVDLSDNDTQVSANPAHLIGVYVNTVLSAQAMPIKDGGTGGTALFTLVASLAAGSFVDCKGARFETDLHVDPDDSATGSITVLWRPI